MAAAEPLSLDAIVRDVANQLHRLRENPPKDPVIKFAACEIELSVTASVEGGGGIKFYVFEASGKASRQNSSRITLKFDAAGSTIAALAAGLDTLHIDRNEARVQERPKS